MKCKVLCHMESDSNVGSVMRHSGNSISVCVCETHGWRFQNGGTFTTNSQCPIGQIEDATESALRQIQSVKQPFPCLDYQ
jgi:hypothetical protein